MSNKYDGLGSRSVKWLPSRYSQDDQRGAGNGLAREAMLAALRISLEGRVIELAPVMDSKMSVPADRAWSQIILADGAMEGHTEDVSEWSGFEAIVTHSYHVGCHVDDHCHNGIARRAYNGWHYKDFFARSGVTILGAENMKPRVTRGVCLDIAFVVGKEILESGFAITPEHVEEACGRQKVEIRAGDAVLLHTGWMNYWSLNADKFLSGDPGWGRDLAHWIADRRVSMIGGDNWALEVIPFEIPSREFVIHPHLLAETALVFWRMS